MDKRRKREMEEAAEAQGDMTTVDEFVGWSEEQAVQIEAVILVSPTDLWLQRAYLLIGHFERRIESYYRSSVPLSIPANVENRQFDAECHDAATA